MGEVEAGGLAPSRTDLLSGRSVGCSSSWDHERREFQKIASYYQSISARGFERDRASHFRTFLMCDGLRTAFELSDCMLAKALSCSVPKRVWVSDWLLLRRGGRDRIAFLT